MMRVTRAKLTSYVSKMFKEAFRWDFMWELIIFVLADSVTTVYGLTQFSQSFGFEVAITIERNPNMQMLARALGIPLASMLWVPVETIAMALIINFIVLWVGFPNLICYFDEVKWYTCERVIAIHRFIRFLFLYIIFVPTIIGNIHMIILLAR